MLYIPSKIQHIIDVLYSKGFEAYIVGGCVRDMLLGIEPHDFDITTSASPEEVITLFDKTIPTGIKHGTVTVVIEGEPIEVTTFRNDGEYSDCRRPDKVTFVRNLKDDLARRDFTVNAMAFNTKNGLQDYFCGKKDLDNHILRAVGNPDKRFHEDALRILRLFRFSSVLNFKIEKNTLSAAVKSTSLLENISHERIMSELSKAVCGVNPFALHPLTECGGINFLGIKKSPDFEKIQKLNGNGPLALFSFLYLSGCDVCHSLEILKSSNAIKNYCKNLILLLNMSFPYSKPELKKMLDLTSVESVKDYLSFESAVFEKGIEKQCQLLDEIIKFNEPYKIQDLSIGGKELSSKGLKGHDIKTTLDRLLELVQKNPEYNTKDYLIQKALEINS